MAPYQVKPITGEYKSLAREILNETINLDRPGGFPLEHRPGGGGSVMAFHSVKIGSVKQKGARGVTIGTFRRVVLYDKKINKESKGSIKLKSIEPKYKNLFNMLQKLFRAHFGQRFDAVRVNANIKAKKHRDSKNVGVSTILGMGNYSGGRLKLYPSKTDKWAPVDVNVKNRFIRFNSTEIEHGTTPFSGKRYTFVFFKHSK